jgi:hypothetical protein
MIHERCDVLGGTNDQTDNVFWSQRNDDRRTMDKAATGVNEKSLTVIDSPN